MSRQNKQQQVAAWKRIKEAAALAREVATQNINTAARLESEAMSALELLGSAQGRRRKVNALTPEQELELMASITRGKSSA